MSNLVHISNSLICPGIKFQPDRDTHDAWESVDFLWTLLSDFGYQHCIYGCIGCLDRMDKGDKEHLPPEPSGNYGSAFSALHEALGQLPENLHSHLSDLANGGCPACAILAAMKQFSVIARYSENKPVGWDALPCYFEEDIDRRGSYFSNSVRHIEALRNLDLSKLPARMPPAERRDAKARLAPGKAVIEFAFAFHERQVQLPPTMSDDELWAVLVCSDQIRTLRENNVHVSPRWMSWAKESILSGNNDAKGAFVSRVALVAFDCSHNIQVARDNAGIGMWIPEVYEYSVIRAILTAAYFYSSGITLSEQGSDVWFEKATQGFIVFDRDDFGKRYYGLSALGRALALRHGGSPPPFLQQEAEKDAGPASNPTPPSVTVNTTDVIDNDVTVTTNFNAQAAALGGDGGKGGDSDSVASVAIKKDVAIEKDAIKAESRIENGAVKMEANPTIHVAAPDMKPIADLFAPLVARLSEPEARTLDRPGKDAPIESGELGGVTEPPLDLSSYFSAKDLAVKYGVKETTADKRLERFRQQNHSGWYEVSDRGPNDPKYLYLDDAVTHLLKKK